MIFLPIQKMGNSKPACNSRVEEMNWKQWRTDLGYIQEEDPGNNMIKLQSKNQTPGRATDHTHLFLLLAKSLT